VINGSSGVGACFYNAAQLGTFSVAATSSGPYLEIGRGNLDDAGEYWNGEINDVRVYNRALSAAEIQEIYNAEK
jgi:hypothetical protein